MRDLLEAGTVRSAIDRRYELSEVPDALRYLGTRHARGARDHDVTSSDGAYVRVSRLRPWRRRRRAPRLRPRALLVPRRPASEQRPGVVRGQQASLRAPARAGARVRRGVRAAPQADQPALPRRRAPERRVALPDLPGHARFSKDKSPYKTNVGIRFRHERARDAHAPATTSTSAPARCSRAAASAPGRGGDPHRGDRRRSGRWRRATRTGAFAKRLELGGDSLKRVPNWADRSIRLRGRPEAEGLLRLGDAERGRRRRSRLRRQVRAHLPRRRARMRLLCEALDVPYWPGPHPTAEFRGAGPLARKRSRSPASTRRSVRRFWPRSGQRTHRAWALPRTRGREPAGLNGDGGLPAAHAGWPALGPVSASPVMSAFVMNHAHGSAH